MSNKIDSPTPDRYGQTYQSGISDDTILESEENINSIALVRKEAAHIILKILSKLDIPWRMNPKKLPEWEQAIWSSPIIAN